MQDLRPQLTPLETQSLGLRARNLCFTKLSRKFLRTLNFIFRTQKVTKKFCPISLLQRGSPSSYPLTDLVIIHLLYKQLWSNQRMPGTSQGMQVQESFCLLGILSKRFFLFVWFGFLMTWSNFRGKSRIPWDPQWAYLRWFCYSASAFHSWGYFPMLWGSHLFPYPQSFMFQKKLGPAPDFQGG